MSYKDHEPFDLARAEFKIHQLEGFEKDNITNSFAGYVNEVIGRINDGKEATVYLCRAPDGNHLAAKIYKARHFRHFDTDRNYRNFGKMRDRRLARAMRGGSKKGKQAFHKHWIDSEWRMLNALFDMGVRVPKPHAHSDDGILMDFVSDGQGPAPRLVNCRLEPDEAARLLGAILADAGTMIENDIVHGDFSAYNILYDGSQHCIIDLPQAIDVRLAPDAYSLFQRDLVNIERYFAKYGLAVPIEEMMRQYF